MHLSLLSDGYFSDAVDDAGRRDERVRPHLARAHREGLLRGLAVIGIAGLLLALTVLPGVLHPAEANTRCQSLIEANAAPPQAAIWWEASTPFSRSTEAVRRQPVSAESGTAVTLVALRQRFRSVCR